MLEIDNPFDGEAARLFANQDITEQQARDYVVRRYLMLGDTRALAHWLLHDDYSPGEAIKKLLSYMFQPERFDKEDPTINYICDTGKVPYKLIAKKRVGKAGRKTDPETAERNQAIFNKYNKRLENIGFGGSESVISELVDELGPENTESMIREAIKKRSPKSS